MAVSEEWFIVVNPHAGSGKTISLWKHAEKKLAEAGIRYAASPTDCRYHAVELAAAAAAAGYRRFIAVGGDGTVHEVLGGIMKFVTDPENAGVSLEEFTLGVIPIGSGNDWIRAHKVKNDVSSVVDLMARGAVSRQDVAKVSIIDPTGGRKKKVSRFAYMINVGGVGLDARICRKVNRVKERGKGGKLVYVKALITEIIRYKVPSFEISCDGRTIFRGRCFSIAFGIGRYSGGGLRQTPDAVFDDGLVDLTVIKPPTFFSAMVKAVRLFNGTMTRDKEVISRRSRRIVVKPLDNMVNEPVEVDGEILGHAPVMLEVYPQQIKVISALTLR